MGDLSRDAVQPGNSGDAVVGRLYALGRLFLAELSVAATATRRFGRRPGLVAAVIILATLTSLSNIATARVILHLYHPGVVASRAGVARSHLTFGQRWARQYGHGLLYPVVLGPAGRFALPLRPATTVADSWLGVLRMRLFPGDPDMLLYTSRDAVVEWPFGVMAAAVSTLLLVGLLGWVKDSDRYPRIGDWPRCWKAHYTPVLVVAVILVAAWPLVFVLSRYVSWLAAEGWIVPFVLLMLAPFAIVARGIGAKAGMVEGLRLLRRRWLSLVGLFVIFRVGYEVLAVWKALAPWPIEGGLIYRLMWGPATWMWAYNVGLALLGLWVAYAFMKIASGWQQSDAACDAAEGA